MIELLSSRKEVKKRTRAEHPRTTERGDAAIVKKMGDSDDKKTVDVEMKSKKRKRINRKRAIFYNTCTHTQ